MTSAENHRQATEIEGSLRLDRYLLNLRSGDEVLIDELAQLVLARSRLLADHISGQRLDSGGRRSQGLSSDAMRTLRSELCRRGVSEDRLRLCELMAKHVQNTLATLLNHASGRTTGDQSDVPPTGEFGATEIITELATDDSTIDPGQVGAWMEFQKGLARLEPELKRLVDLLFFVGLSMAATAEMLAVPEATVRACWKTTKVRLAMAGADLLPS